MSKTNAIRILESKNISHEVISYDFNEEEIDAVSVARKIGMPPEEVFKTLIARASDNEILVFVIPGNLPHEKQCGGQAHSNQWGGQAADGWTMVRSVGVEQASSP